MKLQKDLRTARLPHGTLLAGQFAIARSMSELAEKDDPRSTPASAPEGVLQVASAGIDHLSPLLAELVELSKGPEQDDYGRLRPTQYAFDRSAQLLIDAAIHAATGGSVDKPPLPHGCLSTADDGGVRVEWVRDKASVHLVVSAAEEAASYIYYESGDKFDTEDATAERLARRLRAIH